MLLGRNKVNTFAQNFLQATPGSLRCYDFSLSSHLPAPPAEADVKEDPRRKNASSARPCFSVFCVFPQVIKESGPPHMKSFVTRVSVGEFSAEGEGNSKKLSKKRAATTVLQELRKLPPLPVVEKPKLFFKKRPKTIVKVSTCLRTPVRLTV